MRYKVLAALKEDMNQGWVWISYPEVSSRSVVEIKNKTNGRSIFCEALQIDENYKYAYKNGWTNDLPENEAVITVNSWYRNKLKLGQTNQDYELGIYTANHLYGKIMTNFQHPQIIVRAAMWLGFISVALGTSGLCIGYHT